MADPLKPLKDQIAAAEQDQGKKQGETDVAGRAAKTFARWGLAVFGVIAVLTAGTFIAGAAGLGGLASLLGYTAGAVACLLAPAVVCNGIWAEYKHFSLNEKISKDQEQIVGQRALLVTLEQNCRSMLLFPEGRLTDFNPAASVMSPAFERSLPTGQKPRF